MVQYTIRAFNENGAQVHEWRSGPVQTWELLERQIGQRIGIGTHSVAAVSDALRGRTLSYETYDLGSMLWECIERAGPNGRIEVLP